jgi:methylenetetrahydrofolate reductase (NADPH)
MKIRELLSRQKKGVSFEFFPPKTQADEEQFIKVITKLEAQKPCFASITYAAGGGNTKNTLDVIKKIKKASSVTLMPHLTCIGQDKQDLADMLSEYQKLGIENVLALRGDPPKEPGKSVSHGIYCHSVDLVRLVASLNVFSVGVAVYPEGHPDSPNIDMDIKYTKEKIDAGADFALTQMFFDNCYFYRFMERVGKLGVRIPIIPGIMPVTDITKIKKFSQMCGATLPPSLVEKMEKARSRDEAWKTGIDYATRQCEDLLKNGAGYLHFFTLNRTEAVTEILRNLAPGK